MIARLRSDAEGRVRTPFKLWYIARILVEAFAYRIEFRLERAYLRFMFFAPLGWLPRRLVFGALRLEHRLRHLQLPPAPWSRAPVEEALARWRWVYASRRARRMVRRTASRYPWTAGALASIASPIGMGNDGQKAYDLATRTWFGTFIGVVTAMGLVWYDITSPIFLGGATQGGIVDANGPIQAAFTKVASVGAIMLIPPGTWRTSQPLRGTGACWVMGVGMASSTLTVLPADYANFINSFIFIGASNPDATSSGGELAADIQFSDFRIDGQYRNSGGAAGSRLGGIQFGIRNSATRVHIDDVDSLPWSVRIKAGGEVDVNMAYCQSSRGAGANGSDDISGGWVDSGVHVFRHRWNSNLNRNSAWDFTDADQQSVVECTNRSPLSVIPEAVTNSQFKGIIGVGLGGVQIQSDQSYAFAAGTTNCQNLKVSDCMFSGADAGGGGVSFGASIIVLYGKGGAATVLGSGILIEDNLVQNAPRNGIAILEDDSTENAGGGTCNWNIVLNPNVSNNQTGINMFGTSNSDGGVGFFFAKGGVGTQIKGNRAIDYRGAPQMRHAFEYGMTAGGPFAGTMDVGLDNYGSGTTSSVVYVPGTLTTPPFTRRVQYVSHVGTGTITPNPSIGEYIIDTLALNGAVTINAAVETLAGQEMTLQFTQGVGGGFGVVWTGTYNTAWQPSPVVNMTSWITLFWDPTAGLWQPRGAGIMDSAGNAYIPGRMRVLGTDNYFGAGALADITGAGGTAVHLGSLGDANNAWIDMVGSGANVGGKFRAKGTGGHSFIGAGIQPPQDTKAAQIGSIYMGTGVPNNANGANGDIYFRYDTPATANQRVYNKQAGAWVGIL